MYPVIKTWKAVENEDMNDTNQWLYFWTIYSLIYIFETVFFFVVSWVWFYYEIKLLFVLWLSLPTSHGASIIFDKVISPTLTYNEENIDNWIGKLTPYLRTVAMKTFRRGSAYAVRRGTEMIEETQGDNAGKYLSLLDHLFMWIIYSFIICSSCASFILHAQRRPLVLSKSSLQPRLPARQ